MALKEDEVYVEENGKKKIYKIRYGICICCEQYLEIVPKVGMCGACTWGEADCLYSENW